MFSSFMTQGECVRAATWCVARGTTHAAGMAHRDVTRASGSTRFKRHHAAAANPMLPEPQLMEVRRGPLSGAGMRHHSLPKSGRQSLVAEGITSEKTK